LDDEAQKVLPQRVADLVSGHAGAVQEQVAARPLTLLTGTKDLNLSHALLLAYILRRR
jgi:hypothetical protein